MINNSEEDLVARVKEITGRKLAYGAVDCVAGELTAAIAAATRPGGTVLVTTLITLVTLGVRRAC